MTEFEREVADRIAANGADQPLQAAAHGFMTASIAAKYSYNFSWLGRPVIQYPQDIVAMQELIWSLQPDLIVETGIAHGGSLIFSASMLELNAACGGPKDARVVGVDIDIRAHNRAAIEAHPMMRRITMIEGSSIAPEIVAAIRAHTVGKKTRPRLPRQQPHPRPRPRRARGVCADDDRRQLLRRLRHHRRGPAAGIERRPSVGSGRQPEDGGAQVPREATPSSRSTAASTASC